MKMDSYERKHQLDDAARLLQSKDSFTLPIIWALLDFLEAIEEEGIRVKIIGLG